MVPHSEWKWSGHAGHLCVGRWCMFHLHTQVGRVIVSTVGEYLHPRHGGGNEQAEAEYRGHRMDQVVNQIAARWPGDEGVTLDDAAWEAY